MKAIMIKSKNEVELKFLTDLLKKLGINANVLDIEDIEDIAHDEKSGSLKKSG